MLEEPGPHPDSITEIGIKGIRGEPARVLRGLWKDPLMRGRIKALQKHDPPPGGWRRVFGQAVAQRRGGKLSLPPEWDAQFQAAFEYAYVTSEDGPNLTLRRTPLKEKAAKRRFSDDHYVALQKDIEEESEPEESDQDGNLELCSTKVCSACQKSQAEFHSRISFKKYYVSADGHWRCPSCMKGFKGMRYTADGETRARSSVPGERENTCEACTLWTMKCRCKDSVCPSEGVTPYNGPAPFLDCTVGTAVNFKGGKSGFYLGSVLKGSKVDIGSRRTTETSKHAGPRKPGVLTRGETFEARCDAVLLRIGDDRKTAHEFVPLSDLERCVDRDSVPPDRWEPTHDATHRRSSWKRRMTEVKVARKSIPVAVRTELLEMHGDECFCCRFRLVLHKVHAIEHNMNAGNDFVTVLEAGHVWAHAKKGPGILENLIPLCSACNGCMGQNEAFERILAQKGFVPTDRFRAAHATCLVRFAENRRVATATAQICTRVLCVI